MITFLTCLILFVSSGTVFSVPDPYVIEAKVQQDLENSLSRLISREQFVLQVSADVKVQTERRFVEGENLAHAIPIDPEDIPPPPMPGFVPEPLAKSPLFPQQTRQIFKTVDVPTLERLKVHTSFDDQLPLATVTKARVLVTGYLNSNYPGKGVGTFAQMPMIKIDKKKEIRDEQEELFKKLADWDKKREKPAPTLEEQAWKYGRWTALILLALTVMAQFLKPSLAKIQHAYDTLNSTANEKRNGASPLQNLTPPTQYSKTIAHKNMRQELLDRFLIRSEVFRTYYERLSEQTKAELHGAIGGPGYDRLLEGLDYPIPSGTYEPGNVEEFLEHHSKHFDEMVKASDWQDRQFFGFLHQLRNDQILNLAQHVSPRGLAMMLRFMKPHQSAGVLDSLPPIRRIEVLSSMQSVLHAPLSESHKLEREVRDIVHQLPIHGFGTEKENVTFWGNLVSESSHPDELLEAIEKTNPEIYGTVKKFKFSLEDIATLPQATLESILSGVDNSELGQALATCGEDIADLILDAVSAKRRQVLISQIASYRRVPREALSSARASLTRKFRETLTT